MIQLSHAYAFMGGAFIGRFTGIIPSIMIAGMMLYVVDSSIFSIENIKSYKEIILNLAQSTK